MDIPNSMPQWQRSIITLSTVLISIVVFALLYWAREVFIPLAMAIFFAYVLAPLVNWIQRRGLGRTVSVILVVGFTLIIVTGVTMVMARQVADLSNTLADNKDNLKTKIESVRMAVVGNGDSKIARLVDDLEQTISPRGPAIETPPTVVVESPRPTWLTRLQVVAAPVGQILGLAAFSFILVVFILLAKEDLQDRLMRVFSGGRITSATRAASEANRRVSRYLLSQLVLNIMFGLIITIGLLILDVPLALLWGMVAALMRYVPYIGTWVGVILPMGFSIAVSQGWWQPLAILAIYITLELICNNLIEPRLFSSSMGVSEVALLLSAAFWSFLWGPIGLILSGPITSCLLVLGKYHPQLRVLYVLLGNDPPVTPGIALYQRLLAGNPDDALRVAQGAIPVDNPVGVFDSAILPALSMLKAAKTDNEYDDEDEQRAVKVANTVIKAMAERIRSLQTVGTQDLGQRTKVMICPAADLVDQVASDAFAETMVTDRWEVKVTATDTLGSELLDLATAFEPQVVVIGCVAPSTAAPVRYLCKRLRGKFPNLYLLVGWWGQDVSATNVEALLSIGASAIETTFASTSNLLAGWRPIFAESASAVATESIEGSSLELKPIGTAPA